MNNQLQTAGSMALEKLQDAGQKIDAIIDDCLPVVAGKNANFVQSLTIAKGVHELKQIMLNSKEIEGVVMSMANNRLGFLTDRPGWMMKRNKDQGKFPNEPYGYYQLVDPIVEGLLKGYRLTNNEMNIISGQFYAAKNGNYRKVAEFPGMSGFVYNNDPVVFSSDRSGARVKCWASWKLSGKAMSIGMDAGDELILQIRVNVGMGEDAIIGKAHSKLFKRVLERISGQVAPESTDLGGDDIPDAEIVSQTAEKPVTKPAERDLSRYKEEAVNHESATATDDSKSETQEQTAKTVSDLSKNDEGGDEFGDGQEGSEQPVLGDNMDEDQLWELFRETMKAVGIRDEQSFERACAYAEHNAKVSESSIEKTLVMAINNRLSFVKCMAQWTANQKNAGSGQSEGQQQFKNSGANSRPPEGTHLNGLPQWGESHPLWTTKWQNMRTGDYQKGTGLAAYVEANKGSLGSMPQADQIALVEKFERIYEGQNFPHQLPWMGTSEDPDAQAAADAGQSGLTDAEMRTELRAARVDLVGMKQQDAELYNSGIKNLLQQNKIANKIPAQMTLDECNLVIEEVKALRELRDKY
jgi:hypothetical protein